MTSEGIALPLMVQYDALANVPLILFLLCPLLILVGAALPPVPGRPFRLAALLILGLGTASLFLAMPGAAHVDATLGRNRAADAIQWIYRSLAMEARIIFVGLTAIYLGVILLPEVLRRNNRLFSTALPLSFLVLYSAGAVFLVQITHSATGVTWNLGGDAAGAGGSDGSGMSSELRSE